MEVRLFNKNSDYDIAVNLWKQREHAVVPTDLLSDYGFIVHDNGIVLGAMWLYPMVTTKWSMIRFPITNPDISNELRNQTLDLLFDTAHKTSVDMGFKYIFCSTNHPGLIKRLNNYGYTLDAENCSMFWGEL